MLIDKCSFCDSRAYGLPHQQHQDDTTDCECLNVMGLAHAHSLKPFLTGNACVLFMFFSGCSVSRQMLGLCVPVCGSECMQEVLPSDGRC
jgi:hypothetical protein